jgi:hypothetical protein
LPAGRKIEPIATEGRWAEGQEILTTAVIVSSAAVEIMKQRGRIQVSQEDARNYCSTYCFASGRRAKAIHDGSFVWGDSTDADVQSSTNDQFTVRASGGVRFFTDASSTVGVQVSPGGTGWSAISDRNVKEKLRARRC